MLLRFLLSSFTNTAARRSFQPGQLHLIFNFNAISMPEFNFNQVVLISAGLA
jgi:hypothetical protein